MGSIKGLVTIVIGIFIWIGVAHADDVPNIFSDGQTASASEVNENFKFLSDKLNSTRTVRSNGVAIGTTNIHGVSQYLFVTNDKGHVFLLYPTGNISAGIFYYKTNDCSGIPYIKLNVGSGPANSLFDIGAHFQPYLYENNGVLYYYPLDAQTYRFEALSYYTGASCTALTSTIIAVKALVNDPAATGIPSYPLPLPITIDGLTTKTIIEE